MWFKWSTNESPIHSFNNVGESAFFTQRLKTIKNIVALTRVHRRHLRMKSPSIPRERTRDELIDSIVHTRTREHRAMPGEQDGDDEKL